MKSEKSNGFFELPSSLYVSQEIYLPENAIVALQRTYSQVYENTLQITAQNFNKSQLAILMCNYQPSSKITAVLSNKLTVETTTVRIRILTSIQAQVDTPQLTDNQSNTQSLLLFFNRREHLLTIHSV